MFTVSRENLSYLRSLIIKLSLLKLNPKVSWLSIFLKHIFQEREKEVFIGELKRKSKMKVLGLHNEIDIENLAKMWSLNNISPSLI